MRKKVFVFLLSAVMALSFSACGNNSDQNTSVPSTSNEVTSSSEEKEKTPETITIKSLNAEKNEVDLRNILSETVIPGPVYEKHRQEIETAAEKAADVTRNYIERLKEKEKIMQYTLSVPYWYWTKYQSAVRQGKARSFASVKLSRREQISVMECEYDGAGFRQMSFNDQTGMGVIL